MSALRHKMLSSALSSLKFLKITGLLTMFLRVGFTSAGISSFEIKSSQISKGLKVQKVCLHLGKFSSLNLLK
jgi:hypothetical protein